jgi:hypothetical protein
VAIFPQKMKKVAISHPTLCCQLIYYVNYNLYLRFKRKINYLYLYYGRWGGGGGVNFCIFVHSQENSYLFACEADFGCKYVLFCSNVEM